MEVLLEEGGEGRTELSVRFQGGGDRVRHVSIIDRRLCLQTKLNRISFRRTNDEDTAHRQPSVDDCQVGREKHIAPGGWRGVRNEETGVGMKW